MFIALDVFFTGLVGAYAFSTAGVIGVLAFIPVQQVSTSAGHLLSNTLMRRCAAGPLGVQRWGVAGLASCLLLAGTLPLDTKMLLALLSSAGGLSRGVTYGSRLWMEAHLQSAQVRQQYLSLVEASSTLFKVLAPSFSLVVLALTPRFETIYLLAGALFLLVLVLTRPGRWESLRRPGPLQLGRMWRQRVYWASAPYFLVEGASHALRTALFVSGAMAVVGSLKGYAAVEMGASLCAAAWLLVQSRVNLPGPSLPQLKRFQSLLALAWLSLLLALWLPWVFPLFILLYAVSLPLVTAQKSGVTLSGMVKASVPLESNLVGRSLLLMTARITTLGVFAALWAAGLSQHALLVGMVLLALLLLPLEYATARCLHREAPARQLQ